ncbi:823_t:CDS:2 [Ambispora gerdemannii]|uniref:823_t:CDS:1 n=1 Tax=Ambispora gerdemannii TaxID=144530 RepID=A0A9N9FLJ4_9GLOM|nr:823_t:CDS:2 [Ambispora gerdemannii]
MGKIERDDNRHLRLPARISQGRNRYVHVLRLVNLVSRLL